MGFKQTWCTIRTLKPRENFREKQCPHAAIHIPKRLVRAVNFVLIGEEPCLLHRPRCSWSPWCCTENPWNGENKKKRKKSTKECARATATQMHSALKSPRIRYHKMHLTGVSLPVSYLRLIQAWKAEWHERNKAVTQSSNLSVSKFTRCIVTLCDPGRTFVIFYDWQVCEKKNREIILS